MGSPEGFDGTEGRRSALAKSLQASAALGEFYTDRARPVRVLEGRLAITDADEHVALLVEDVLSEHDD